MQKIDIQYKEIPNAKKNESDDNIYARPFLLLSQPRAKYTDAARMDKVEGTVVLEIVFKATGDIGSISIVHGLGGGLNKSAVDAAKNIRFLPAEIDGTGVDVTKSVEYTFSIY